MPSVREPIPCRPSVIDAHVTAWALPYYSPSPDGVVHGLVEMVKQRFRGS
jgi:acetolactate synthase I/II/III large subunit